MAPDQNLTEEQTMPIPPVAADCNATGDGEIESLAPADESETSNINTKPIEGSGTVEETQEPASAETVPAVESQSFEDLAEKLNSLSEEKQALYDRLLRKQAEFENFRKRTEKEKQEFYEYALANFLQGLLPILDGLERSASVQEGETIESYKKGIDLILKQFRDVLWAAGVQPIRAMGKLFDPNFHQAVLREENSTLAENEIIEEYQRGYVLKERLLRPSMVKVAVAPIETLPEPEGDSADSVEPESSE